MSNISFSDNMKKLRERNGLTQEMLSRVLGIAKSTVSMYENGNREPDFTTLKLISEYFKVDMNHLLGCKTASSNESTAWAKPIINRYRNADRSTQAAVCAVLRLNYIAPDDVQEEMLSIRTYAFPSAAGIPAWVDEDYDFQDFPAAQVPHGTDLAIRISGDSMEPTIQDGSYAFVHIQPELEAGQVGIFMLDGDTAVCKRLHRNANSIGLHSDNPKYKPIIISSDEQEGFRVVGRVLASVAPI